MYLLRLDIFKYFNNICLSFDLLFFFSTKAQQIFESFWLAKINVVSYLCNFLTFEDTSSIEKTPSPYAPAVLPPPSLGNVWNKNKY